MENPELNKTASDINRFKNNCENYNGPTEILIHKNDIVDVCSQQASNSESAALVAEVYGCLLTAIVEGKGFRHTPILFMTSRIGRDLLQAMLNAAACSNILNEGNQASIDNYLNETSKSVWKITSFLKEWVQGYWMYRQTLVTANKEEDNNFYALHCSEDSCFKVIDVQGVNVVVTRFDLNEKLRALDAKSGSPMSLQKLHR
uniref:Uncharacterized protein n=1 Tax=Ditylenchus dipsaci TaxID=166011 RepID=A0A915CY59_9BILA